MVAFLHLLLSPPAVLCNTWCPLSRADPSLSPCPLSSLFSVHSLYIVQHALGLVRKPRGARDVVVALFLLPHSPLSFSLLHSCAEGVWLTLVGTIAMIVSYSSPCSHPHPPCSIHCLLTVCPSSDHPEVRYCSAPASRNGEVR